MKDKLNILVTGGAGFIGSNIVDKYIDMGHRVWVLDNLSSGDIKNINPSAEFIEKDILSKDLDALFEKVKFDIVNHHAAQINIRKSVSDPMFDAGINILGTINILENIKKHKIKKIIFSSSGGAIYGESEFPNKEGDFVNPISPYGIAKLSDEFYIKFYAKTYGFNYLIFRYSNVYGPRQSIKGEAGVVAIFFDNFIKNIPSIIFGSGEQKRDFVFVKDVALINSLALDFPENITINVSSGNDIKILDLYKLEKEISKSDLEVKFLPKRLGEIENSLVDNSLMKKVFKIELTSLKKGLEETFNFYNNKYSKNLDFF